MITYQEFPPSIYLHPYVECYWTLKIDGCAALRQELIIPGGRAELIFNFNRSLIWHDSTTDTGVPCPFAFLLGQRNRYFFMSSNGQIDALGIRLRPGGLAQFTDIPVHYFHNSITALPEVIGPQAELWLEVLNETPSAVERVANIEFMLSRKCRSTLETENRMKLIAAVKQSNAESVGALCNLTGIHYKKLERIFHNVAGYTPKNFVRVMRFYKSLMELRARKSYLTTISLDAGYYDQSHFIHDFKQFTGVSPSKFVSRPNLIPDILLKSNFV
jgi:AraC-like DNA-binding protein